MSVAALLVPLALAGGGDARALRTGPPAPGVDPLDSNVAHERFVALELAPLGAVHRVQTDYDPSFQVSFDGTKSLRGVPCAGAVTTGSSGTWSCTLGAPWRTGWLALEAGHRVTGQIASRDLYAVSGLGRRIDVHGVPCRDGFTLHPGGGLGGCALAAPYAFPGTPRLPAGAHVDVGADGVIFQATFTERPVLDGRTFKEIELECGVLLVEFAPDGSIREVGDAGCGC